MTDGTTKQLLAGDPPSSQAPWLWPWSGWPVLWVCCAGGLVRIIYAFGYGYGLSMVASAAMSWLVRFHLPGREVGGPQVVGLGLYAAYGARLFGFLYRRQNSQAPSLPPAPFF